MGLIYSFVTLAILWPAAPAIFKMMGHDRAVADMEIIYFRIMLYAQVMAVFSWSSSQFFMGIHRPIITMWAAICGQAVNIAANYVLIFGKLGFPAMGIAGAGWGTFIGTTVGASIRMTVILNSGINTEFKSRKTMYVDLLKMVDLT